MRCDADVEEEIARRRRGVVLAADLAEGMELPGLRCAEQPVPGVGAEGHDAGEPAVGIAETDRAQQTRQVGAEAAHGRLMVRSVVHRHDEEHGGARQRRGDRLGTGGRHALLHTDLFGGAVILRWATAKSNCWLRSRLARYETSTQQRTAMAKPAQRKRTFAVEDASLGDVVRALGEGKVTASDLARAYLARIEAYDSRRAAPQFRARDQSRRAVDRRAASTARSRRRSQPLAGVPILVKDNIATGDKQHTTAGSLALASARARDDATVVKLLRDAGAVILGKANLTEFANMLAIDMPSGYSSLGGQVKNPYAPALMRRARHPGRAAGRLELGLRRRRRGRPVRRGDRHRDLGLAAQPREPERPRHREADGRTDQPRRHPADLAQPGHRRPDDAHGARRGDPAERAGGARSARSRDAAAAAAGRLHRRPRQGRR